jgi:hypothetical protein
LKIRHDRRNLGIVRGEVAASPNSHGFPRFNDRLQQTDPVPHFILEWTHLACLLRELRHDDPPGGELLRARATGRGGPLLGEDTRGQEECCKQTEHEDLLHHAGSPIPA